MTRTPPRLAERLLTAAIGDDDWSDAILGDLHEEHAARAARSPARANGWYWLHAIRIATRARLKRPAARRAHTYRPAPELTPNPGDSFMRTLGLELRYALRSLRQRPAMSAIVVLTLGLGLGANAAVFSMIDALIFRPFTMRDADRITMLSFGRPDDLNRRENFSPGNFLDVEANPGPYEHYAAFQWWTANLVGRDEPENVQGFFVSSDFFAVLGVQMHVGRAFRVEEETRGQHRRIVLGHDLWQRRFAADPSIVGRSIRVDGDQYDVVGIAAPGFDFPMGSQIWAPLAFDADAVANRRSQYLTPIARLAPGRTLDEAKAQMAVLGERLAADHPETNRGRVMTVYTLAGGMMDVGVGPILSMWQAAAGFVLLIACANVASLLLARGAERQREMAVRLAIGASRGRIMRGLLLESGLLAAAAIPAGLAIAWGGLRLITAAMPPKIARFVAGWYQMDIDLRVVAFLAVLSIVTALLFGAIPALQASRPQLTDTLKEGGRSSTAGAARLRLRRGLVIAEIALALPLLVAAALSVLAVNRFLNGPQGFNPNGVLGMRLQLPAAAYPSDTERRAFVDRAVERLGAIPGVEAAAAVNVMPSSANNAGRSIEIDGRPNPDPANPPTVDYRAATPGVFTTLEIPLRAGRGFTDADRDDTQPVTIVSDSLVQRYWPGEDPIGKRIKVGNGPWMTVVGVCGDVIHDWFGRRNYPTLYRPFRQAPTTYLALLVRTAGDAGALALDARTAVRAVDASQPVFDLQPMQTTLRERTIGLQFVGGVMFAFGGLALLLAIVGVYGVMASMVAQRTHEIGVRMALGATRGDVLRLTVTQTGRLTAIGVGAGLALSLALGRLIEAGLVGVASSDARVTAALAAVLIVSALTAGYLPARRAASIDPSVALRGE